MEPVKAGWFDPPQTVPQAIYMLGFLSAYLDSLYRPAPSSAGGSGAGNEAAYAAIAVKRMVECVQLLRAGAASSAAMVRLEQLAEVLQAVSTNREQPHLPTSRQSPDRPAPVGGVPARPLHATVALENGHQGWPLLQFDARLFDLVPRAALELPRGGDLYALGVAVGASWIAVRRAWWAFFALIPSETEIEQIRRARSQLKAAWDSCKNLAPPSVREKLQQCMTRLDAPVPADEVPAWLNAAQMLQEAMKNILDWALGFRKSMAAFDAVKLGQPAATRPKAAVPPSEEGEHAAAIGADEDHPPAEPPLPETASGSASGAGVSSGQSAVAQRDAFIMQRLPEALQPLFKRLAAGESGSAKHFAKVLGVGLKSSAVRKQISRLRKILRKYGMAVDHNRRDGYRLNRGSPPASHGLENAPATEERGTAQSGEA